MYIELCPGIFQETSWAGNVSRLRARSSFRWRVKRRRIAWQHVTSAFSLNAFFFSIAVQWFGLSLFAFVSTSLCRESSTLRFQLLLWRYAARPAVRSRWRTFFSLRDVVWRSWPRRATLKGHILLRGTRQMWHFERLFYSAVFFDVDTACNIFVAVKRIKKMYWLWLHCKKKTHPRIL